VTRRFSFRNAPRLVGLLAGAILCLNGSGRGVQAQQSLGVEPATSFKQGGLEVLQIRPNVYMIAGAGGNIVAHVGWMGVVLIDSGSQGTSDDVLAVLEKLTPSRIRLIFNTGADPDHVGGNEALSAAGRTLLLVGAGAFTGRSSGSALAMVQTIGGAATVMAHENVLNRMSGRGGRSSFPSGGWPNESFNGVRKRALYLNSDHVQATYQPAAHSDADVIVYWRRADVVATGDLVDLRHFPVIDTANGGTIDGLIDALTQLIGDTAPPAPLVWHDDRTLIVPGHGRLMDHGDLVEYRDMVKIIRDRVADLAKKGMSLQQIKAQDPTQGYGKQYGATTGEWTTDMFVEAVHKTLTKE
jgi:glyoxylase-like metal-dependent hydrolase (beta-lactamase superfamily II)